MSAVVFDMDGTLTDTEHIWDVVRRGLAERGGFALAEGGDPGDDGHVDPAVVGVPE